MPDLAELSAGALYLLVWALIFTESGVLVAFWLPGDTVLFTAGIVAQATPGISLWLLAGGSALAAVAGNAVGYWTGARYGRPWLERRPPKVLQHLLRAEAFYERHGSLALVIARFIPWARTFVPVLAGVSRMKYSQFLLATVAGALVWGAGLIVLGYYAATVPWLRSAAHAVAITAVALSVVVPVVGAVRTRRAARRAAPGGAAPGGAEPQRPSSDTE